MKRKNPNRFENQLGFFFVGTQTRDRTGMEVNPLVFETSASTNSAIWANSGCKSTIFFGIYKEVAMFLYVLQLLTD
jgi:hypothetical protein